MIKVLTSSSKIQSFFECCRQANAIATENAELNNRPQSALISSTTSHAVNRAFHKTNTSTSGSSFSIASSATLVADNDRLSSNQRSYSPPLAKIDELQSSICIKREHHNHSSIKLIAEMKNLESVDNERLIPFTYVILNRLILKQKFINSL